MYLHTVPFPPATPLSPPAGWDRLRPARVLIVDADAAAAAELSQLLETFGIAAESAASAQAAEAPAPDGAKVDLVVVDVDLPGEDGFGLCRRLAQAGGAPILILSRRCEVMDRIIGLEYGADDYLPKSTHPLEVVARVKALLRRGRAPARAASEPSSAAGWSLHASERRVQAPDGRGVRLSTTEFRLLAALFPRCGEMMRRDEIAQAVYGGSPPQPRSIDVLASRVRRKLTGLTGRDMITCVRGAGYVLEAWPSHARTGSSIRPAFAAG